MADLHEALRSLAESGAPPPPPVEKLERRAARIARYRRTARAAAALAVIAVVGSTAPWWWPAVAPSHNLRAVGAPPIAACAGQPPGCGQGADTAADLAAGRWVKMAPAPLTARSGMSSAWTGQSLLVWGGATYSGAGASYRDTPMADGASYTPATDSWSPMAPSPLSARTSASAVWDGTDAIVWGGQVSNPPGGARYLSDGASYDPTTGTWRGLPPSPLSGRSGAYTVWTGDQVLLFGGRTGDGSAVALDGAAFDPVGRRWTAMPAFPGSDSGAPVGTTAVWTGHQLLVWATYQVVRPIDGGKGAEISGHQVGAAWTPGSSSWDKLPAPPKDVFTFGAWAFWDGQRAVLVNGSFCLPSMSCPLGPAIGAKTYSPATGAWGSIPANLVASAAGALAWTGHALVTLSRAESSGPNGVTLSPGDASAWDSATDTWTRLPHGPAPGSGPAIWTGEQLIVWGSTGQPTNTGEMLIPAHSGAGASGNPTPGGGFPTDAGPIAPNSLRSLVFVAPDRGWALAISDGIITAAHTTDGGRTWTRIGTPLPPVPAGASPPDRLVAVLGGNGIGANVADLYAFGSGPTIDVSHDRGATWTTVTLPGTVLDIAVANPDSRLPAGQHMWALTGDVEPPPGQPTPQPAAVYVSGDAGRSWQKAANLGLAYASGGALVPTGASQGYALVYEFGPAGSPAAVAWTSDNWSSRSVRPDPCAGLDRQYLAAVTLNDLWLACGGQPATIMQQKQVYRSTDAARHWTLVANTPLDRSPATPGALPAGGHLDDLVAVSDSRAWVSLSRGTVEASSDGGHSWTVAFPVEIDAEIPDQVTFYDATHGWVLTNRAVWATNDGTHWAVIDS